MIRLSVIVITYNEQRSLARCLESVPFADQIVVVDSHSTDQTVAVARRYGAEVITRTFDGYGPSKQFALDQATGEWVLSLDADEMVSPGLATEIRSITASSTSLDGYDLPRLTNFCGRWIRHCGWYPDRVVRLFRRDKGRVSASMIHERIEIIGQLGHCTNDLLHYSYPNLEVYFEKFNRYTTEGAVQAAQRGERSGMFDLTIRPCVAFIKHYISKAGFLDGREGLMVSVLSACAVFVKYSKLHKIRSESITRNDTPA